MRYRTRAIVAELSYPFKIEVVADIFEDILKLVAMGLGEE
jgi:hypothetical protein